MKSLIAVLRCKWYLLFISMFRFVLVVTTQDWLPIFRNRFRPCVCQCKISSFQLIPLREVLVLHGNVASCLLVMMPWKGIHDCDVSFICACAICSYIQNSQLFPTAAVTHEHYLLFHCTMSIMSKSCCNTILVNCQFGNTKEVFVHLICTVAYNFQIWNPCS